MLYTTVNYPIDMWGGLGLNTLNPADCLDNQLIDNVWQVSSRATQHPSGTGGHFSIGYVVKNVDTGKEAFLKAFDFSGAFQAPDFARAVEQLATAYNFERDLLFACRDSRMGRVLYPIADGEHAVSNCIGPLNKALYLIFDLAEGDIRKYSAELAALDIAWCLRSLHHTAVGIQQLHKRRIVHQDIKPSNVLTFANAGTKISDLGRGFSSELPVWHDAAQIPGDRTYAPPELFYGLSSQLDIEGRKAIDVYCLGSLLFFHFLGISATQGVADHITLQNAPLSGTNFTMDLPILQAAFGELTEEFSARVEAIAPDQANLLVRSVRELCEQDPSRRGDPKSRADGRPFDLERYVSRFNLLARKAEIGML